MRVFRQYMCDFGHQWTIERREGEEVPPSDEVCPEGHEAITCTVKVPVDHVQILISPAATGLANGLDLRNPHGRYYLSLFDREGRELCATKQHFNWDAVTKLATFFRDKTPEHALAWWAKRNL
jgi:hypothetical protein